MILTALVIGALFATPNFFGESPAVQVSPAKSSGKLDPALLAQVESALKEGGITYQAARLDVGGVKVRFADTDTQIRAKDVLAGKLGKDYVVALNLLSQTPDWLSAIGAKPMYLGLDLRGGVHFLLQVDMKAAIDKAAERYVGDLRTLMREKRISYLGVVRDGQVVQVKFKSAGELAKAEKEIQTNYPDLTLKETDNGTEKLLVATLGLEAQKRIQV